MLVIHTIAIDFYDNYEIGVTEEQTGVKQPEMLLSALNQPKQTYGGVELYPTVFLKAACLARGLIQNHAFHNANKRTGVLATIVFLGLNGYEITAKQNQLIGFARSIAINKPPIESIARRLKKWCVPTAKMEKRPIIPGRRRYLADYVSAVFRRSGLHQPKSRVDDNSLTGQ